MNKPDIVLYDELRFKVKRTSEGYVLNDCTKLIDTSYRVLNKDQLIIIIMMLINLLKENNNG